MRIAVAMRHTGVMMTRLATKADDAALLHIDIATMSSSNSPGDPTAEPDHRPFFHERTAPSDVIVAEKDGNVIGYVKLEKPTPLRSNSHILTVGGLAVDPEHQNTGVGKSLLHAAVNESLRRGARKLRLRVLSTNPSAQHLYEQCGFTVEGVLREEFLLDGRYVDDILMARDLVS